MILAIVLSVAVGSAVSSYNSYSYCYYYTDFYSYYSYTYGYYSIYYYTDNYC